MSSQEIRLKGVRVHNLKEVNLSLKRGELIVFTGISGSGKSSLAFDTIYVEGQRRYIESLSQQSRRHLSELKKPEADLIEGISPTIAIEQKLSVRTPRSTVGTLTGIYDFLRVLLARIGTPYCPIANEPVLVQSKEKIFAELNQLKEGSEWILLTPVAKGKKAAFKEEFLEWQAQGYTRIRVDGTVLELSDLEGLDPKKAHDVEIVIDRIKVSRENRSRLQESASLALDLGKGFFTLLSRDEKEEKLFSQSAYCASSDQSYGALEPSDFSFNHPQGMCSHCQGIGTTVEFDLSKVIDEDLSIQEDCCKIASSYNTVRYGNIYNNLGRLHGFNIKKPWKKLSDEAKKIFLYGVDAKWVKMRFIHPEKRTRWIEFVRWKGVIHETKERLAAATSESYKRKFSDWMQTVTCPDCKGARIKAYPAATRFQGKTLLELIEMPLDTLSSFFSSLKLTSIETQIGEELVKEIRDRLHFLNYVGLSYLSLSRTSPTLSGGESQRVRLAAQIGAGLVGAIYVLDEPSIGLHPQDHHKLIQTLQDLKNQGNTVIVVEHDADTMRSADTIVDVGPGAGKEGGRILSASNVEAILKNPESITGKYLSGTWRVFDKAPRKKPGKKKIKLFGATHHNLKNVDVEIPLGCFVSVTGLSGSGKSSLISHTLYPALANYFHKAKHPIGKHQKITGLEYLDKIIAIDQYPIGRTPRSNPATYIKLFDEIRDLFAKLPESKLRGFDAGHFSFNVGRGSCPYCHGLSQVRIDMDFMEDAWVECPQCQGKRFDPEILSITFKGKNITDILNTDVQDALDLFKDIPSIRKKLQVLSDAGLDYLNLGQPSTTLSGGEAQRIKLAKELVRPSSGKTLYILDEPTTGLHFHDIRRLLKTLKKLVDQGNTVLVIEHNLDLIEASDWILDLGPGAGVYGGELLAAGTPEMLAKKKTPTGKALAGDLPPFEKQNKTEQQKTTITIEKAFQNNLKGVSLTIPHQKMTVLTGPSGSGKSSIAFDTLYAEGQRRYTETLPPYARAQVKQLPKPKVELIDGLLPSIALEQKTGGLNPRSSVGTMSEVYDLLRVLYAHLGVAYCPETKEKIEHISKEFVVERILSTSQGKKLHILAPTPIRGSFETMIENIRLQGFVRIRLNKKIYELEETIPFESFRKNELELVIDRLIASEKNHLRLLEAIEKATSLSQGILLIDDGEKEHFFNLTFAVPSTGKSYPPITPQTFSFNHNQGMCLECQGLGTVFGAHFETESKLLNRSIFSICKELLKDPSGLPLIEAYFQALGISDQSKLKALKPEERNGFFFGGKEVSLKKGLTLRFKGLNPLFAHFSKIAKAKEKEVLSTFLDTHACTTCEGSRLNPLASSVLLEGLSIHAFCLLGIDQAQKHLEKILLSKEETFLQEPLEKSRSLLRFLSSVGLGYLSLHRSAPTLSGGELQRIRLARQIGSGLTSCLYILDEPTIGLHPYNTDLLYKALRKLLDLGNTLVLVEHDLTLIEKADFLIDVGPHSGHLGGKITAKGTPKQLQKDPLSLTGSYLAHTRKIPIPEKRRPLSMGLTIENASLHNLQNLDLSLPVGAITGVSGVSGSGKSTLIRHLLKPAAELALHSRKKKDSIQYLGTLFFGLSTFEKVITIDQSPIGQTARADVSTYTDVMPHIRSHFASLPLSLTKGFMPAHFSPNHLKGMCSTCWGLGYKTVSLQFLPAAEVPCDGCNGLRLNPLSLEVCYQGKNLGEILQMNIQEAIQLFEAIPKIVKRLKLIESVGLSYLPLGREVASLSGGEAQRLRLCKELAKRAMGKTLYLIDEPTVGLHSEDIQLLLPIFHRLADQGHTLIIIEHHLDILANADYLIDLGPDAGELGGKIIAKGRPEEVAKCKKSRLYPYLADTLTNA